VASLKTVYINKYITQYIISIMSDLFRGKEQMYFPEVHFPSMQFTV